MPPPAYSHDALRAVMRRHGLTGSMTARLLRVDPRTVRKWCAPPDIASHRKMPESAWWLLLILIGEITVADLKQHLGFPNDFHNWIPSYNDKRPDQDSIRA